MGTAGVVAEDILIGVVSDFSRLGKGEFGNDGGKCCPDFCSAGGGVNVLVMLGCWIL